MNCPNCDHVVHVAATQCMNCGAPIKFRPYATTKPKVNNQSRTKGKAIVLCLLLGVFGAHRMYLGDHKKAWCMLLLSLIGIGILWTALDLVRLIAMRQSSFDKWKARIADKSRNEPWWFVYPLTLVFMLVGVVVSFSTRQYGPMMSTLLTFFVFLLYIGLIKGISKTMREV